MSANRETRHAGIQQEIQKLQTFEQNCLQGLANCDGAFHTFAANSPNSESYQQQYEKAEKDAMITTYTFLYVKSLKEEKMAELAEMENKIREEKMLEAAMKLEEKIGECSSQ